MNEKDFAKEPHSKKRLHIIIEIRVKEFFLCIHIVFACMVFKNYINYGKKNQYNEKVGIIPHSGHHSNIKKKYQT